MQLSYKARYENGQLPAPVTADISFAETGIAISYHTTEGTLIREHWMRGWFRETTHTSAIITLRSGEGVPYKQLDITDQQALAEYRQVYKPQLRTRRVHPGRWLIGIALAVVAALVLAYLYLLPFVADQMGKHVPKELEISMGKQLYAATLEHAAIDSARTEAINQFFAQLHIDSEYPIQITVVKDTIVNAFAVPGGGIVVYDAILHNMKTPETLAALLAHEYSHIALKHATRGLFRNLAGYLFVSLVLSDANGITAILLRHTENLRTLTYSRALEEEADRNGLEILKTNRISPAGMVALFVALKSQQTESMPEAYSTHPDLDARIAAANTFTQENPYPPIPHDSLTYYFNQLNNTPAW